MISGRVCAPESPGTKEHETAGQSGASAALAPEATPHSVSRAQAPCLRAYSAIIQ